MCYTPWVRLSRIRIDGYRAIRTLDLGLDELTALIGENGFGKTSLLDALVTCLGAGAPSFAPEDFHVPPRPEAPADRIVLTLTFVETRPGERALRPELAAAIHGPPDAGSLVLRVEAEADGAARVAGVVSFLGPDDAPLDAPAATFAALRRACPAIVVRAGRYFVRPTTAPRPQAGVAPDRDLERHVLEAFAGLSAGGEATSDAQAGIDAARTLVSRYAERAVGRARKQTTKFLEAVAAAPGARSSAAALLAVPGGAAQGLAALLILGAMVHARGDAPLGQDADPVLVVEDPEAHLHPLLAANVSRLIEALPGQRLLTTNSGELLATIPLRAIRRLVRLQDGVHVHQVERGELSLDDLRRVGYHVRGNRADALFARCWLLVEGETEFWVLPELARVLGIDLPSEGVRVVEFAQCGVDALVKMADALGIAWHLLADGDEAGRRYAERAGAHARDAAAARISLLDEPDIEHLMWAHGLDHVYRRAAGMDATPRRRRGTTGKGPSPTKVIIQAIAARSKPRLALEVLEAIAEVGPPAIPEPLRLVIDQAVRLARATAGGV